MPDSRLGSWTHDGISSSPVVAAGSSIESSILGSLACRAGDDSGDRVVIRGMRLGPCWLGRRRDEDLQEAAQCPRAEC
jgi:hypothetical protein